jgi:hypothetical protein
MKKCLLSLCLASMLSAASGQKISYSDVDRDDYRQMNFEIIGKVNGNTHVYKSYKNRHEISVFDGQMKLRNKMKLAMLPEKVSNVEFIAYADHYHMLYQSQKRDVVSFSYVKLDGDAKMLAEPVILDTSHIDGGGEIKVYNVINSENRERIMVYKISRRNDRIYTLTTLLFDRDLNLLKRSRVTTQQPNRDGMFNDFVLDNAGDLAFGRSSTTGNREYITNFHLLVKRADADTLTVSEVPLRDFSLDEVKIRPDNYNGRFLLTSFYYGQKKGNIDGLLSLIWDKNTNSQMAAYRFPFNDTLRADARTDNTSLKMAFNDYFIRQVVPTREGGFAVISELYYTNTRGGAWNRWDYLYGPMGFFPYNNYYYSPFMSINQWRWADPWNRWGAGSGLVRHVSENIMVFFFGRDGRLEWSNTVRKKQYDDNSDVLLSYLLFNTGSEVRFLFNQLERREQVLNSVTLNAAGKIKRDPTMKGLDANFEFMPRYGKQVGPREVVMPCIYRNYICFAKLDF